MAEVIVYAFLQFAAIACPKQQAFLLFHIYIIRLPHLASSLPLCAKALRPAGGRTKFGSGSGEARRTRTGNTP